MYIKLQNLKIHYKVMGEGEPILLLHGWGCSTDYFAKLQQHLAKKFKVYAIDLPGFGMSDAPEDVWGSFEYAKLIADFVHVNNILNLTLLGHSFGGKVSINLVGHNLIKAKKIILIGSNGVQLPKPLKLKTKILMFKIMKKIFGASTASKNKFGSSDYRNTSPHMRLIFVKTVNEDKADLLPKINIPALLIWGEKDTSAPLRIGKIMHKMIPNSQLKILANCGHFPFVDNYEQVITDIDIFLNN